TQTSRNSALPRLALLCVSSSFHLASSFEDDTMVNVSTLRTAEEVKRQLPPRYLLGRCSVAYLLSFRHRVVARSGISIALSTQLTLAQEGLRGGLRQPVVGRRPVRRPALNGNL
ncbi:MAG: hypothetical protein ACLQVG_06035, partial [Terriglobia bacterium]